MLLTAVAISRFEQGQKVRFKSDNGLVPPLNRKREFHVLRSLTPLQCFIKWPEIGLEGYERIIMERGLVILEEVPQSTWFATRLEEVP